jgi:hypothetical protein
MTQTQKPKTKKPNEKRPLNEPWLPMRNGIIIIAITSIGMTVLTALQVVPAKGWGEGLLWSIFFGAMIWAIFFGLILANRFLRR